MILYYLEYVCNIYNIGFVITIERLPCVVDVNVIFLTQKMRFAYTFLHFPCKPLSNSVLHDV